MNLTDHILDPSSISTSFRSRFRALVNLIGSFHKLPIPAREGVGISWSCATPVMRQSRHRRLLIFYLESSLFWTIEALPFLFHASGLGPCSIFAPATSILKIARGL
jgi:hypothetical protein